MEDFDTLKAKGNVFFKKCDYETAVIYYQKAITADPSNPIGYSNNAMGLIKLEKWSEAVDACNKGLEMISPENDKDGKIVQKLEWRKEIALKNIGNNQPLDTFGLSSQSHLIDIPIYEVDRLPDEYVDL